MQFSLPAVSGRLEAWYAAIDWQAAQLRAAWGVQLVAAVIGLYFVTRLFWLLAPAPAPDPMVTLLPTVQAPPAPAAATDADALIRSLRKLHVFGQAGKKKAVVKKPAPPTPKALKPLDLKLTGIVYSSDPDLARAMINHKKDNGNFQIGDFLPGGQGVLEIIETNHVEIRRGEQLDKLYLYGKPPTEEADGTAEKDATQLTVDDRRKMGRVTRIAKTYYQRFLSDPGSLAQLVRFKLITDKKGNISGYRIEALSNVRDFGTLGFQK